MSKPERFSASVAKKHMACHASANLPLAIPNWEPPVFDPLAKTAANKGTGYHDILETVTKLPAKDMLYIAQSLAYVAEIRSRRRFKVLTEVEIEAAWLVSKPKTKVDVVLHTQDEIHVIDWKTGKIPVNVVGNEQLLYYGVAFAPLAPKAKGVHLHVVQPWADGNMEEWFASTVVLKQFMEDTIAAEAAIAAGDTTFQPGDHCTFCAANPHGRGLKGRPFCPEMMKMLYPSVPIDTDEILNL